MAKTKISEFSATPGNNTDIDGINIAEGCAPSGINDAIRELMSQLKDFQAGTAGDSFNGPVGTTTAAAGAFTTLSASSTATLNTLASSGATLTGGSINNMAIGGTTAAAASVTTLTTSSTVTHNGGTANGVAYLNGSKVLTTGSALTYNGAAMQLNAASFPALKFGDSGATLKGEIYYGVGGNDINIVNYANGPIGFIISGSEQMRLTSTGLGIGTSSPGAKLDVRGTIQSVASGAGLSAISSSTFYYMNVSSTGLDTYTDANASAPMLFKTGGTERMRLDSYGNLGLGVTPSAWGSNFKAMDFGGNVGIAGYSNSMYQLTNAYAENAAYKYKASTFASAYLQTAGQHQWYTAPSGTAGNAISFTQAMTLDASGNLGVGTTSPTARIHSNGTIQSVTGSTGIQIYGDGGTGYVNSIGAYPLVFQVNSTERARIDSSGNLGLGVAPSARLDIAMPAGAGTPRARIDQLSDNPYYELQRWTGSGSNYWGTRIRNVGGAIAFDQSGGTGAAIGSQTWTQAMTLDASGNLLVGTTSTPSSSVSGFLIPGNIGAGAMLSSAGGVTSAIAHHQFINGNGIVGQIYTSGSTTTYATSSDYRLKNITGPVTNSGAYIDSLNPVEGTWKADGSTFVGLIAHEVQEASRTTVATGKKDGDEMQAMDYSSSEIIANMIAELKSLRARVAQLESN